MTTTIRESDRKAMLIDVSKCMGCRGCQVACKQWNQLPAVKTKFTGSYQNPPRLSAKTWTLISFTEVKRPAPDDPPEWLFLKHQCLHCGEASCLEVCPTGAIRKSKEGIVYIDQAICAGCKYCVESCPFNIPHPDRETGTARKCRMCLDRVSNGQKPACVTACPTGALDFGDRGRMLEIAHERVKILESQGFKPRIYGETELGGLGAMYVLTHPAHMYGLPEHPKKPHWPIFGRWMMGVVPGLAILWAVWRRMRNAAKPENNTGGN